MILVQAKRLRLEGRKLSRHEQERWTRAFLWILPGGLVSGSGPVYRALNAQLVREPRRPGSGKDSIWPALHDTSTIVDSGTMMVYGNELLPLPGGGYTSKRQCWACRPIPNDDYGGIMP